MAGLAKILGVSGLLVVVFLVTAIGKGEVFVGDYNIENLLIEIGMLSILGVGVAFVIISGGIDLSIGSVVALVGVLLPMMVTEQQWPFAVSFSAVLLMSAVIGLIHGLLITKLNLQPFVVTLCGLLVYRSIARWIAGNETKGYGEGYQHLKYLVNGRIPLAAGYDLPVVLLFAVVLAIIAGVFLNQTIYGRYLFALGRNEMAARYSGINNDRMKIMAYVICSVMAGLGGVMYSLFVPSASPSGHGEFFELYAIAAAVLGGCSLRGGEGSILGVMIGAALIKVLASAAYYWTGIDDLENGIMGAFFLIAVIGDEFVRRITVQRRRAAEAKRAAES